MAAYKIEFFGWCRTEGHDKVWGWVSFDDAHLYNFWGRRGRPYTFKRYAQPGGWRLSALETLARAKTAPGRRNGTYEVIAPSRVAEVVPNFAAEFEHQLTLAKLFDKFHGETVPALDI